MVFLTKQMVFVADAMALATVSAAAISAARIEEEEAICYFDF
jgi:hypothetical protein